MGTYQAIYAIGMLSGPAVSGALSDSVGINAVFYLAAGVTIIGAILVVIRALPNRLN
jgi:MFS family permease